MRMTCTEKAAWFFPLLALVGCGQVDYGTLSCAEDAVANVTFSELPSPPFRTVETPYGQESCPDRAVVRVAPSLIESFDEIIISGLWSSTLADEVPCDASRRAHLAVFVEKDGAWQRFDRVEFIGEPEGQFCAFTVAARDAPLPEDAQSIPRYGWTHVPTQGVTGIAAAISAEADGRQISARVGLDAR